MKNFVMRFFASIGEMLNDALFNFATRQGMILCAISLPNGALVSIAATQGTAKTNTAVSNASPGVMSMNTGHGYSTGDLVVVTSGWSRLTDKVVRLIVSSDAASLEGIDTTLTSIYPALGGVGSCIKINSWTQLSQVLSSTSSGGDQQFLEYQLLEADAKKRIPSFKNPSGWALGIADDPTLAGYILASVANDDRLPRAVKITLPGGALIYMNAYISLNKVPSLTVNAIMECQITMSMLNEPVRYAS